ncbi:SKP1/BTB/POZ domain-containing protein [Orpheovirus IHUMI-LCC2]|uniref:SKP1/BTB/POZ domain-containing protein n=1 Tax=Orpheovirus IHUMI-LCC2 TaxID=2023057 RepID=A0A2I2L4X4_9VIRU|nr:SKP1/BTB/POZ domain-containing protein [Orpheovirus IHUMI-LCC2]SNW62605.1 SKP1/BTB/POZ domain-containing protein [Orpheovirus IHUMI-LCC2]
MDTFYNNKNLSDVQVKCSRSGKVWHCHKVILSIYSNMLKHKFTGSMADKNEDIMELDIDENTIEITLKYIYEIRSNPIFDFKDLSIYDVIHRYIDIYALSNYWEIPTLEGHTLKYISMILDSNNTILPILLKDYLHFNGISDICEGYIRSNFIKLSNEIYPFINIDLLRKCFSSSYFNYEYDMYLSLKAWGKTNKGTYDKKDLDEIIGRTVNFDGFSSDQMKFVNMKKYTKLRENINAPPLHCSFSPDTNIPSLPYPFSKSWRNQHKIPNNYISMVLPQTPPRDN